MWFHYVGGGFTDLPSSMFAKYKLFLELDILFKNSLTVDYQTYNFSVVQVADQQIKKERLSRSGNSANRYNNCR